jgi:cyclic dehypoxanthinyl futalosine synthase
MDKIISKALKNEALSYEEALDLYKNARLSDLMWLGNELRKMRHPSNEVGWIIDRNVNITNVCTSRCKFCNFHRVKGDENAFITSREEYRQKIEELFDLGGDQLLLQGGLHPDLGLDYYKELFSYLKEEYPELKLHALGPPEIDYLARRERMSYRDVLLSLRNSGMDSLPGAGAEILCDDIRRKISGGKAGTESWLEVMNAAHRINLPTSATMMYGHIENKAHRIEHLLRIRQVQEERPEGSYGFITFVPWPFQADNTKLKEIYPGDYENFAEEYIRIISISRIVLNNIDHIQASWLTVGLDIAQICLHAGADDLGSIMIEENVVSSAGASYRTNSEEIQKTIQLAGFKPRRRNQKYETIENQGVRP